MCVRYYIEDENLQQIMMTAIASIPRFNEGKYKMPTPTPRHPGWRVAIDMWPKYPGLVYTLEGDALAPQVMQWGFPRLEKKALKNGTVKESVNYVVNARDDQVKTNPFWRDSFRKRRLVAPVSGFYEWGQVECKKEQLPFRRPDGILFYFAGVWEPPQREDVLPYYSVLTTVPNESIKRFHDRMPILLTENELEAWIRGDKIEGILGRVPFELEIEQVS